MKLKCETCNTEFEHRKRVPYCSRHCDPKRHKECATCGNAFFDDTRVNKIVYCGDECNPNKPKSRDKKCSYCETPFRDESARNNIQYCSDTCQYKGKIVRKAVRQGDNEPVFLDEETRSCEQCSSSYTPRDASQKYCTVECREEAYGEFRYEDVPSHLSREVTCLECSQTFQGCIPHGGRSGNHFEEVHGMTTQEYQVKHDAPIYCEASIWKQKQKTWTASEEARQNYSNARLKYYSQNDVWNKGMSPSDHPSVQQQSETMTKLAQSPDYVNGFKGKNHTEEYKQLKSKKQRELLNDFVYNQNWIEGREFAAKLGMHISEPHAVLMQAMRNSGLWDRFQFDYEVWQTLSGIRHGIDIATKTPFKLAISVDGCYYHGCPEHCDLSKLNTDNQMAIIVQKHRNGLVEDALALNNWKSLRFWEHELKEDLAFCIQKIASTLDCEVSFSDTYQKVSKSLDSNISSLRMTGSPSVFGKNDSTEMIKDYYRMKGFPYYRDSSKRLRQDFGMLCKYDVSNLEESSEVIHMNRKGLGMKAPNYFMRNYFDARRGGGVSMVEVFNDDDKLVKVIESRKKHAKNGLVSDATMRTGLKIAASAPASFPAAVAKYIYSKFLSGKDSYQVIDPCAGFGGRMDGSQSLGFPVEYTGFDPWTENVRNLENMREWFGFDSCSLINLPFEEVTLEPESFDMAFTSPPHYNKEIYTREATQSVSKFPKYEDWVEGFLQPMIQKVYDSLRFGSYFVLHVSDMEVPFVQDSRDAMSKVGFDMKQDIRWKQQTFLTKGKEPRYETFLVGRKCG